MKDFSDLLNAGTFGCFVLIAFGVFVYCVTVKVGTGKWPWEDD